MWDALQDVARTITLVLDKGCESHKKCPRCRGSGLLENAFTRLERNKACPNQPCWFCEGVGALPIAGLNGFVLARATSSLKAIDKLKQPCAEFSKLNQCRYGDEKSKFTTVKLGVDLADLFYNFSASPWISDKNDLSSCTLSSLDCQQDLLEKSKTKDSIVRPCAWERVLQLHSSFSYMQPVLINKFLESVLNAPLDSSAANNLQPNAALSLLPSSVSSLQPNAAVLVMPLNKNAATICRVQDKLRGTRVSYTRKTSNFYVPVTGQEADTELTEELISKPQTQTAACVLRTQRRRPLRKTRSCIRDKARKEALERARGLIRTLRFHDQPVSASFHEQPVCEDATSRSLQGTGAHGEQLFPSNATERRDATSRSLQGTGAHGEQLFPPRVAFLTSVDVSRQSRFNRLTAGKVKALMPISKTTR